MKRTAYQADLQASPAMLCYGTNPAVPGDLLRDPGDMTKSEVKELNDFVNKLNNKTPVQTPSNSSPSPELPSWVTHVYTKQHATTGLQPSYCGPFPIISKPTKSSVQIRVGHFTNGQPKYEVRNIRDLKVAHLGPESEEASRPKRGRPPKSVPPPSSSSSTRVPDASVRLGIQNNTKAPGEEVNGGEVNKMADPAKISNDGGKRATRSTRNPNPIYVDSLTMKPASWSASSHDLAVLNHSINSRHI